MSQRVIVPWLMGKSSNGPVSRSDTPTDSSDVVLKDYDDGYNNAGLEVTSEFVGVANRELINRELVNLENAAVNIDNSSDVIIGPVTQFNVNGNVTIYQNKDEQAIGIENKSDTDNGALNGLDILLNFFVPRRVSNGNSSKKKQGRKRQYMTWVCCVIVLVITVLSTVKIIFLSLEEETLTDVDNSTRLCACPSGTPKLIGRYEWGGSDPTGEGKNLTSVQYVIIKHTAGDFCETEDRCKYLTKRLQELHMSQGMSDISYNFLVGGDGNVYIGRGFSYQSENLSKSIDIAIHGNFFYDLYYDYMINATQVLINYGVQNNIIWSNYSLLCHNQTEYTTSPGRNVYREVVTWCNYHYDKKTYYNRQL